MTESTITASRRILFGACRDWPNVVGDFPTDLLGGTITQTYRYLYDYVPAIAPVSLSTEFSVEGVPMPGYAWPSGPLYGTPNGTNPLNGYRFGIYGESVWWEGQVIEGRWILDLGDPYPPLCAFGLHWGSDLGVPDGVTIEGSEDGASWIPVRSHAEVIAGRLGASLYVVPIPDDEIYHRFWSLAYTFQCPGSPGYPIPEYLNFLDAFEGPIALLLWPRSIALRGSVNVAAIL